MPYLDYAAIRARIPMQRVLTLLQFQPFRRLGNELRGSCPVHGGTSPRSRLFSADVAKNAFRCFRCGAQGNQLDLWAAVRKQKLYDATVELCRQLGEDIPVRTDTKQAKPR